MVGDVTLGLNEAVLPFLLSLRLCQRGSRRRADGGIQNEGA